MTDFVKGGDKLDMFLVKTARRVSGATELRVGYMGAATYPDGTSVALVAAVNEFGSPSKGIPPRPSFRNMITKNSPGWAATLGKALTHYDWDAAQALDAMGEVMMGQLQESILETNEPPNAPVTNLLKQRFPMGGQSFADVLQARYDVAHGETAPAGKPLVQSGNMLNSVTKAVK